MNISKTVAAALTFCVAWMAPPASAQDYGAMIQQSLQRQNQIVQAAQARSADAVRQRMQDPQVQAAYRQYQWRMHTAGQRAMDFPTFTYQWIYTAGFSQQGIRHAQQNEANNRQNEQAAVQRLRQAQAERGQAQGVRMDGYARNSQEAGRGLMGLSTYTYANGATGALPHTWAANTTQQYQGNTYHVDAGGQYHVQASNGWWYPVNPQR